MPTPDADLSAILAAFTARNEQHIAALMLTEASVASSPYGDLRKAIAAVEAVLKLADTLEPQAPPGSALEEDRMWIRQECADMIREAITRALNGETGA